MAAEPNHPELDQEARERWGQTVPYLTSATRVAGYGDAEWRAIRTEAEQIVRVFAELLAAGEPASGERARAVAARHRDHISRWFYPCSAGMHRKLGEMYVSDERFARNYEQLGDGLSIYLRDAIVASAEDPPARRP